MSTSTGAALKPGVIAVAAASLALAVTACGGGGARSAGPAPSIPDKKGTTPRDSASSESAVLVPKSGVPKVDYTIDLETGVMTPLPRAIIRSLAKSRGLLDGAIEAARLSVLGPRYAATPDGSKLAYVGTGDDGNPQIFMASIDGTGVRQLTNDPTGAWTPAWSPDGSRIAYNGSRYSDIRNVFVLDVAKGMSTQVTWEYHRRDWDPQFTPDGSSLIYTGGSSSRPVIRTVPATGGKSTLLIGPSRGLQDAGNGSLSPDGSLVTYLAGGTPEEDNNQGGGHCGPCRLVANADGTERRIIPGWDSNPAGTWSPDGSRIVTHWQRELGTPDRIMVVDVATGDASLVADGKRAIWLNRHTLLVEAR